MKRAVKVVITREAVLTETIEIPASLGSGVVGEAIGSVALGEIFGSTDGVAMIGSEELDGGRTGASSGMASGIGASKTGSEELVGAGTYEFDSGATSGMIWGGA